MAGSSDLGPTPWRYTAFPNLYHTINSAHQTGLSKCTFELPASVGVTREAVILAWAILLRGYTRSDAVVFGLDDAGVVRVDFENDIVEELRDGGAYEGEKSTEICFAPNKKPSRPTQLCLHVDLEGCKAYLAASEDVIPRNHLRNIASQVHHIVTCVPTGPNYQVPSFPTESSSPVSSQYENSCLSLDESSPLSVLNPRPVRLPGPSLLHDLIRREHRAPEGGNAIEFLNADGTKEELSYGRFHALSDGLARRIAGVLARSTGRKTVPVLLPQSPAFYVALLSILKAGAAFVPLHLDAPEERIRFVVGDVEAGAIITTADLKGRFEAPGMPELIIMDDGILESSHEDNALAFSPSLISPTQAAYIMYTSGSSGKPKGVTISHIAATQSFLAHDCHIPPFQRFLQFAAPTFDVSVFDVFFPLFRGCTVIGCDRTRLLADLPGAINSLAVDAAELTPTVASGLLINSHAVPGLQVLLTIGEMLTRPVVSSFGGGVLQGMYGPTEAAIHCTVATGFATDAKVGDIGVPLDTVSAFVLAPETEDVEVLPRGWMGELAIGGWQLADGYLNRPDLTKGVFVDSPVWGRLYRTGDRARILPEGRIECLGRISEGQVKLRGQRVELGEVEEVVLMAPGVQMAVASVADGSLIVHVTPSGNLDKEAVKQACRQWLPDFMIPSDVVFYEHLPRLPSGKVDRKRLSREYTERSNSYSEGEEDIDLSGPEAAVVHVVEALLGRRPRKDDSLVSLGLDSMQAIRLASRLRASGFRVEVVDVVKLDTIVGIASRVVPHNDEGSPIHNERYSAVYEAGLAEIPVSLRGDVEDIIPCTLLQESMIAETASNASAYCNWILLDLPFATAAVVVEAAFRAIVERHEILRTGFVGIDGGFAQVVWKMAQKGQLKLVDAIESNWEVSLGDMMEPPFSGALVIGGNGDKQLSIRIHHALYDWWSWDHIMSDFQRLLAGQQLAPGPRPHYRNVVDWELSRSKESIQSAKQFWKIKLEGAGETRLPRFHGHTSVQPGVSVQRLDSTVSHSQLEASARIIGVSAQVFVQSAWACILSSYVGSEDVVFGTVTSGRTIPVDGIADIIGPTILTLPVRVNTTLRKDVRTLLREIQGFNVGVMEHPELGLREVRRMCGSDGLFDSLIAWQQNAIERQGVGLRMVESRDKLEFSLLIEIEPTDDNVLLRATYKEEIFPVEQISFLLQQMDCFIRGMVTHPDRTVKDIITDLPLEGRVLSIANAHPTLTSQPSTRTLSTIFEKSAANHPSALALEMASDILDGVATTEMMTYSELNSAANRLARELVLRGALPDELVAICMEKSMNCYVSILATVKAGAGYLPLAPETPVERVRQILGNADTKVLLATGGVVQRIGSVEGLDMVSIDTVDLSAHSSENLGIEASSKSLAYAVFTSGSTGVPKVVLVEHEQAVSNLDVLAEIYPTAVSKRMLQFCNIAFDVSVFEIFFAWHRGMVLCSATKDVLLRDMEAAVNALQVTHLSMTPTVAALMKPDNVPSVEFLVTSGEAVTKKVFHEWAGRGLYQGYGPSEITNICTVNPRVQQTHDISNIGPPFSNTSAFVVAEDHEELLLLPRGAVGELAFGGEQVCRGYLKTGELTARKFVTHPEFGRVYRSGDMGRLLPGDELLFVARRDDQVKIRGHRIELGEINSVLLRDKEAIGDAVTLVVGKGGGSRLVAFVVPNELRKVDFEVSGVDGAKDAITTLFRQLEAFVPAYMVPTAIVPVTKIPMTVQGKTDKKLLERTFLELARALLDMFSAGGDDAIGDWTETERIVADIIAQFTHADINTVGQSTSIFTLGLDSISAITLSRKLQSAGFERLDVTKIIRNHTVSALASVLRQEQGHEAPSNGHPGTAAPNGFSASVREEVLSQLSYPADQIIKILPCTPLQEATLSTKKDTDPRDYYNHTILSLSADLRRLKEAWNIVAKSHEILRTCFALTSHHKHAFAQVVVKDNTVPWLERSYPTDEKLARAIDDHIDALGEALEISKPPYAFSVFKSPAKCMLVMSFHHSLYDGFAMDLLLEDVQRAYAGTELPARTPFDSYLQYMESLDLHCADEFWKKQLSGLLPSSFPDLTGASNSARKQLGGMASRRISCSRDLVAINEACRGLSASLLALGQSTWARLLSAYTGESDICFGNVVSGRTIPVDGIESIVAPCFNTVPVRVQVSGGTTMRQVMVELQERNTDIMPFQLTPLRRIMNALGTEGGRLFDTLFILQRGSESVGGLWEVVEERGRMDFSIVVELAPSLKRNELEIIMHYRRDMILDEHITILQQQFDHAMVSAIDSAESTASDFSFLPAGLISQVNAHPTVLEPAGDGLLHSEFERNVQEQPHHIALQYMENDGSLTTLTFVQINKQANIIANHIISLGVARDEAIPLCVPKSPLFYICILAVLKSGCAFTPIDPSLPVKRQEFMVTELQARIVLGVANGLVGVQIVDVAQLLSNGGDFPGTANPVVPDVTPYSLAYRIYTSGSTGLPKAVSIEHHNAVQTLLASKSFIRWEPSSRLLQFAATTFDMCYYDIFMAWSYGFTLCSAAPKYLLGDLAATIRRLQITMLDLTPTVAGTLNSQELPGVKLLYCIGEAMPQILADAWEGRCVNSYGPTEAAMCCTIVEVSRNNKASNIGRPFSTARFVILHRGGNGMIPLFGSGELCIGGSQVAREYHNNTSLTHSQFIDFNGEVLYRTGDIVRQLADSTFEFIGRADDQIKIRGLRVELEEINAVLNRHESVKDVATLVLRHGAQGKEQLVAFLELDGRKQYEGGPPVLRTFASHQNVVAKVRAHAQTMLPRYMLPTVMLVVDHIPLSAAGKIDKRALGGLFQAQDITAFSHSHERDSEVWSEKELKIREVLAQISRVQKERINRATTIYEVGLDSISTTQFVEGLRRRGLMVGVIDILEHPSIELLSGMVLEQAEGTEINGKSSLVQDFQRKFMPIITTEYGLDAAAVTGVFPCTAVQEGMLSQFLMSNGELYFNHTLLKLPIDCDETKLKAAWNSVVMACDILRSGFVEVDDEVYTFAAVTYHREGVELPWGCMEGVADIHECVEKQKKGAAEGAIKRLHLPPWQLVFLKTGSGESYLLFSGHHALYDATSLQIIFGNVSAAYDGSERTEHPQFLPTLETILFHTLDPQTIEGDRTFWQKQLEGSSITRLPNLCPLHNKATTCHVKELSSSWKLSSLEATCQTLGTSLHSAGQAAWARVLSAYTGEAAPTLGVVLSGRTGLSADGVVFPCLVTLPSVCNMQNKSNRQLVQEIQASNSRALKHQHAPLKSVQRWLEHPEEGFFDSIFVYQKTGGNENELPWEVVAEDAAVDYTFSLEIEPKMKEDRLLIRATARDSHIPIQQTELLMRQFEEALMELLRNPEGSAVDLSGISQELLSITPAKVPEIPGEVSFLHDFVQRGAASHPDSPALEFVTAITGDSISKQTWTYTELDCHGNRIANLIISMGTVAGSIIGICFDKHPAASFAILGILKAGCAYVAIDPTAPIDRKAFIVKDSNATAVFTLDVYLSELRNALEVPVISAENDPRIAAVSSTTPLVPELTGESLCYCLYTSGTTGLPKGCLLTHTNAVQAMFAFQRLFRSHWDANSRWLQFASFHFDVSVLEQFWSWSVGITVVSAPRDVIFQDLPGTIKRLGITHLDLTPSLAGLLRPEETPDICRGVFITGGEALKQDILDVWGATGVIYNGYGPTEVTIGMTMYPRVPANGKPSNIGPQFDNVGTYVLQPGTSTPVPRGGIGELCASGNLVGRGYLNRPELTAKAFPTLENGERIYRTGDLVRILHDDTFDFQGRKDDQVKLRGQRLEIGEIDQVVTKAHEEVEAVATLVLKHPKQQKDQLVSFFVVRGRVERVAKPVIRDDEPLISTLVEACRKKLPTYMVPTHFLPLSHMPLSINNKVNNKALKVLYQDTTLEMLQHLARRDEDTDGSAWTDSERRLRTVLVEMTRLEPAEIKRSSTVFELGLDSVSVVGLARRLKKSGFATTTPSLIMQNPSVSQIASALSQAGSSGAEEEFTRLEAARQKIAAFANKNSFDIIERLKMQPEGIEHVLPCTPLQEGMIARFLDSQSPIYYNSFPMLLGAQTDLRKLYEAWKVVVKATDILRTCFCETPDGYAQIVLKHPSVNWEEITIKTEDFQEVAFNGLAMSVVLNRNLYAPPFSIQCIRTPTRCVTVLNIFHALYDGNSLPLILKDVQSAYRGAFTPRPAQFADVVVYLLSTNLESARSFWKEHIKPSKPLDFQQLRSNAGSAASGDHTEELTIDLGIGELDQLCKRLQCTPRSIFQAAWASALAPYCGPTVTLGLVVSGHSLPFDNIEGVVGPTFNTIPASFDVADATSWEALIGAIFRFNSASMPYHHTPLRLIQKWMRRTKEMPLFETLFVFQKGTDGDESKGLWEVIPGMTMADYPLALEAVQSSKGVVTLTMVAKAELAREKVVGILRNVAGNLRDIFADPGRKPLIATPLSHVTQEADDRVGHDGPNAEEESFDWNSQAKIMRKTIAELAEVAESEVSASSSILELGLDSIEAIKLSSRLRQKGIEISVSNIMRNATIRTMLKLLDDAASATPSAKNTLADFENAVRQKMPGLGAGSVIYPTTPLQEAMIAETLASGYTHYFNHDVLKLEEWVDIDRLKAAWKAVTNNNDILRTSFISTEGIDVRQAYGQVVHPSAGFFCHWEVLQVLTEDAVGDTINATMEGVTNGADILAKPMVYATVLKAPESTHMVLSMSHALYDGWSIGLLHEDLRRTYFHTDISRLSPRVMIEKIVDTNIGESNRFWSQKLDGVVPSSLPASAFSSAAQTKRAEIVSSIPFTEAHAFCKQVGATLQSLGQTCWALMLAYYLGETDVVFGSVLSGRDFDGADEIMFPAMNTVPVRAILHGSYRDLLAYVQENGAVTLRHQHTPLREIQRLVGGEGARLFDTIFLYQRSQAAGDAGKPLYRSVGGSSDVEYNIAVEMERSDDSITWRSACKSTSDEGTHLLTLLDSLLAHVIGNPDHPAIAYAENGLVFGNLPVVTRQSQPVLNGMRVNLDEVSDALRGASPEAEDYAAIVASDAGRDVLIVFMTGGQAANAIPKVMAAANKVLPYWSVPSYVVAIDSIPFAGPKVDREALRARFEALPNRQQHAVEQQTGEWSFLERKIRTVLSKVSGFPEDEVQRIQTIFHLGLDSISAIQLASDLRKESIFLKVADILREATIERMAAFALEVGTHGAAAAPPIDSAAVLRMSLDRIGNSNYLSGISPEQIDAVWPATAGQLYMLDAWESSNRTPFMPTFAFKCARIELSQMRHAWESLVQQEAILRTIFRATGNEEVPFIQVVLRTPPPQFDWSETSQSLDPTFIRFVKAREQNKVADMTLPPVRLCVHSTPTETTIFLTIHHALYDGISLPLLLKRLGSLLRQRPGRSRVQTPDHEGPKFVDFLALIQSQDTEKQRKFWSCYLHDAKSTLVQNCPNAQTTTRSSVYHPGAIRNAASLEHACRKEGVSLHAVFLAAFARVLSARISSGDEVVIGIYLSNRNFPIPKLPEMASPTLNIVPLRIRGVATSGLIDLARNIQQDLIAIGNVQNAVVDLKMIQRWTGVRLDAFFNFLKDHGRELREGDAVVLEELEVEGEEVGSEVHGRPGAVVGMHHSFLQGFLSRLLPAAVLRVLRYLLWFLGLRFRSRRSRGHVTAAKIRTNLDFEVAVRNGGVDVGAFCSVTRTSDGMVGEVVEEVVGACGYGRDGDM